MSRHRTMAILALPLVSCAFIQSKLPSSFGGGASSDEVIETSLPDARTEVAFLDGFGAAAPGRRVASAEWLPRLRDGSMRLRPGLWEYAAQSYCLHAGTHAPAGLERQLSLQEEKVQDR